MQLGGGVLFLLDPNEDGGILLVTSSPLLSDCGLGDGMNFPPPFGVVSLR